MKSWEEIEASSEYKSLSPAQQKAARRKYPFDEYEMQQMSRSNAKILDAVSGMNDVVSQLNKKVEVMAKAHDNPYMYQVVGQYMDSFAKLMEGLAEKITELKPQEQDLSGLIAAIQSIPEPKINIPKTTIPKTSTKKMEDLLGQIRAQLALPAETESPVKRWNFQMTRDKNGYLESITATGDD